MCVAAAIGAVWLAAAQQNISEINWTDTPRMETTAVANQTTASLNITANIPNADIYLNNDYAGKTPLLTRNLAPGIYKLRLSRAGYYDREFYITLNTGTDNAVYIELARISGFLSLNIQPPNAQVLVDGRVETAAFLELAEGTYKIEVRAFGYAGKTETVTIERMQNKSLSVSLERAPFAVAAFSLANRRFNPKNPGNLGKAKIEFSVTAPGSGIIRVFAPDKTPVREIALPPFTTWQQTAFWDGKDKNGAPVADGEYTIELSARGDDTGAEVFVKQGNATVDAAISYPIQPLTHLGGSFGMNPSPLLFPQGTLYASFNTTPYFEVSGKGFLSAPVQFNFLYTPLPWLEASINASMFLDGSSPLPVSGGLALKAGSKAANFSYAFFLRYGIANLPLTVPKTPAGFGAGGSLGYTFGLLTVAAHGEYIIGPRRGFFIPFEQEWNAGLSLQIQKGIFSGILWSQWISTETILSGLDVSVLIPGSNFLINLEYAAGCPLGKPLIMSFTAGFAVLF